jgi:branched-subunit amino acid transport protein
MSEYLEIALLGAVIWGMKALPFLWRMVPRTRLANAVLDLLPAGLLTALIVPSALSGATHQDLLPALLVIGAVVASVLVSLRTGRPAFGIAAGLVLLAIAELVSR